MDFVKSYLTDLLHIFNRFHYNSTGCNANPSHREVDCTGRYGHNSVRILVVFFNKPNKDFQHECQWTCNMNQMKTTLAAQDPKVAPNDRF